MSWKTVVAFLQQAHSIMKINGCRKHDWELNNGEIRDFLWFIVSSFWPGYKVVRRITVVSHKERFLVLQLWWWWKYFWDNDYDERIARIGRIVYSSFKSWEWSNVEWDSSLIFFVIYSLRFCRSIERPDNFRVAIVGPAVGNQVKMSKDKFDQLGWVSTFDYRNNTVLVY